MIRPALRSILALLFIAVLAVGRPEATQAGSGDSWKPEELNWYGISQRRINDVRSDAGQSMLAADNYLWGLAHERARDMLQRNYLGPTTPEGTDAGAYMRKDGAWYEEWTEIQADDSSGDPQDVVAWRVIDRILNDKAGRQTISGPFDRLGVGLAEGKSRRVYVILVGRGVDGGYGKPADAATVAQIVLAAAKRHGIDGNFFLRVAKCESGLNPRALNPQGPYIGLFQFHPRTYSAYGGTNIYDPVEQSEVAAKMFAKGLGYQHWECARIIRDAGG